MYISSPSNSSEPPIDGGAPNTNNVDRTEILRAFDNGNSRPFRGLLRDLQERARVFIQAPVSEKSTELLDAFLTLTPIQSNPCI